MRTRCATNEYVVMGGRLIGVGTHTGYLLRRADMNRKHSTGIRSTRRLVLGLFIAILPACAEPPTAAAPEATRLSMQSGDNQVILTGELLRLAVRVSDAENRPVRGVQVGWQLTSELSEFANQSAAAPKGQAYGHTDASGVSEVMARRSGPGTLEASAWIVGFTSSRVTFRTSVVAPPHLLIRFGPEHDCVEPSGYYVDGVQKSTMRVVVGAKVVWEYFSGLHHSCRARIKALSSPAGGEMFDSGELAPGGRFEFTPRAPGTWEFVDVFFGGRGVLEVTAP